MYLPAEIVRDQRLKRNDFAVACAVWDAVPIERKKPSDPWPYCMLSRRQIEESTGLTKSQVERAFANLARLGHLTTITVDRDTNTYWRKLNVIPAKQEGFGFRKFRTDRTARMGAAQPDGATGDDAGPPDDDDFKPSDEPTAHSPTPDELSEVTYPDSDFEHVLPLSNDTVVEAADRFRQPQQPNQIDDALRIANAQRSKLKIGPIPDTAVERAAVEEATRQCERMDADPRLDMAGSMSMLEFVGHVLAAMVCAHVKGAKSKPHLADGYEATASGLLSRMRHAKVREHLLRAGLDSARRGDLEEPKERMAATRGQVSHAPRR